jgi:hypothetical protein
MTQATETARIAVLANAEACLRWLDRGPDLDAARRSVKWIIECILATGSRVGSIKKLVILLRAYSCPTRSAPPPLPNPTLKWQSRAQFTNYMSAALTLRRVSSHPVGVFWSLRNEPCPLGGSVYTEHVS